MDSSSGGWSQNPSANWIIDDFNGCVAAWLATDPPRSDVEALLLWLSVVEIDGPPVERMYPIVVDESAVARIPGTDLTIAYHVFDYERRLVVDEIR